MGFGLGVINPIGFTDRNGNVDWRGWREEFRGQFLEDYKGRFNGVSTEDLAEQHFGLRSLEACLKMENEIQFARQVLLSRGIILKNTHKLWHTVDEAVEAHSFLRNRSMRIVRQYQRTSVASEIATQQFPELGEAATVQALGKMNPSIKRLGKAVTKDTEQLTSKTENQE